MRKNNINQVIKEQEQFIYQVTLTNHMLNTYKNNPLMFSCLFSEKVKKKYLWHVGEEDNMEFLWEFCDAVAYDIVSGETNFVVFYSTPIFGIDIAGAKKKKTSVHELYVLFEDLAEGWWDF